MIEVSADWFASDEHLAALARLAPAIAKGAEPGHPLDMGLSSGTMTARWPSCSDRWRSTIDRSMTRASGGQPAPGRWSRSPTYADGWSASSQWTGTPIPGCSPS